MKPLALATALLFCIAAPVFAQSQEETKPQKPTDSQIQKPANDETEQQSKMNGFIDTDGDGLNDNATGKHLRQRKQKGKVQCERKRDQFIDNDGDGINDNRCTGLGIGSKNKLCKKRGDKK